MNAMKNVDRPTEPRALGARLNCAFESFVVSLPNEPCALRAPPNFDQMAGSALVRQSQLVANPRRPGVPVVLPFSAATLWRRVADGSFPAPLKMGRITAWRVSDVRAWLAAQSEGQGVVA